MLRTHTHFSLFENMKPAYSFYSANAVKIKRNFEKKKNAF